MRSRPINALISVEKIEYGSGSKRRWLVGLYIRSPDPFHQLFFPLAEKFYRHEDAMDFQTLMRRNFQNGDKDTKNKIAHLVADLCGSICRSPINPKHLPR